MCSHPVGTSLPSQAVFLIGITRLFHTNNFQDIIADTLYMLSIRVMNVACTSFKQRVLNLKYDVMFTYKIVSCVFNRHIMDLLDNCVFTSNERRTSETHIHRIAKCVDIGI